MAVLTQKKTFYLSNVIKVIVLLICGFLLMVPFIWMISIGFSKTANVQMPFPPRLIPKDPSWFNFKLVFENGQIFKAYLNSGIITVCSVLIGVTSSLLGGYAFSKGTFKGKKLMFIIVLGTLMIPMEPRLIPMYEMFNKLGMLNTFWPLFLPALVNGFGIFLCKQYFDRLPDSLRESAQIDGASELGIFFKIYFPLTGPIAATLVILTFISSWNDFVWPLVVLNDPNLQTIPLYLASFTQENGTSLGGLTMALATVSVIPIIILYLFLQRFIIQSIALSGLKE
ncbi:multiple sugar transport system permease protein [Pullulanibacillus pueri]|uniref:Sugar ABC transporter permease n=1 Tax=Pullulanibacillus pueri TaxID=1437324 RepID=A0A8J2ZYF7_9BACL|nr:carbohydrate ABC transporter permease [Pullulanibacillus pueri]MBM7682984.1 multiple sugar transport system permease protein [Pullulanibacillus pueri]GGH85955.1 sugar ABC transporter permease [Pullulanibacillus pueri]